MKTLVIGYKDVLGKGETVLLAGTEIPQTEQVLLVTGCKAAGKQKDGLLNVAFCELIVRNSWISVDAYNDHLANDSAERVKREKALASTKLKQREHDEKTQGALARIRAEAAEKLQEKADKEKAETVRKMTTKK